MNAHSWTLWGFIMWLMLGMLSYLIVDTWPKLKPVGWVWYSFVQLVMFIAAAFGTVFLIPFCLSHSWIGGTGLAAISSKDGRPIDLWLPPWLNTVYGNREDGVSGAYAKIWLNGTTQGPYIPPLWSGAGYSLLPLTQWNRVKIWLWVVWRAYCWSALRNSCDNLKYVFAWKDGPYADYTLFGKTYRFGWQPENGVKVPVF